MDSNDKKSNIPVQPPAPQSGPGETSAPQNGTAYDQLLQIMLQREARQFAEEEAKEKARKAKEAQRRQNALSNFEDERATQTKCRHLKGGKNRLRTQVKDFAVYMHTFVNSERVIRCQLCNMRWKQRDTKEFLVRYGKKIPNHTGLGWTEAMGMLAETSNKPSSSEIPMTVIPQQQPVAVDLDEN